jgi:hypothetical protein
MFLQNQRHTGTTPALGAFAPEFTDICPPDDPNFCTQGTWKQAYGFQGYNIVGDTQNYPAYLQVTPSRNSTFVWAASTSDIRALEKVNGSDRIAAWWFAADRFTALYGDEVCF